MGPGRRAGRVGSGGDRSDLWVGGGLTLDRRLCGRRNGAVVDRWSGDSRGRRRHHRRPVRGRRRRRGGKRRADEDEVRARVGRLLCIGGRREPEPAGENDGGGDQRPSHSQPPFASPPPPLVWELVGGDVGDSVRSGSHRTVRWGSYQGPNSHRSVRTVIDRSELEQNARAARDSRGAAASWLPRRGSSTLEYDAVDLTISARSEGSYVLAHSSGSQVAKEESRSSVSGSGDEH